MDELTRELENLPLRPVPPSLDGRMRLLLESAKRDQRRFTVAPRRRKFHALAYAACLAAGFAAGLLYARRPGEQRPTVVHLYPVETAVRASNPFDWTQGGAPTLPPWDGLVRVDIRLNGTPQSALPPGTPMVPKVDIRLNNTLPST